MRFEDLLIENGIELRRSGEDKHSREGWIQLQCPFCGGRGSGKFHLGFNIAQGNLSCWKCGSHSQAETLVAYMGISYREARKALDGLEKSRIKEVVKKQGVLKLPKGLEPLLPAHRRYLKGRGFDPDVLSEVWDLQCIGLASKLSWRVFIPIKFQGEMVSWTTRSISPTAELRYVSASEDQESIPHKSLLYGEDKAKHAICVVEGPMDVWRIGPGAVATCGTAISRAQILRMAKYPVIGIALDNDTEEGGTAQRRARKLADELSAFGGDVQLIKLDSKDAGCASDEEINEIRKELGL